MMNRDQQRLETSGAAWVKAIGLDGHTSNQDILAVCTCPRTKVHERDTCSGRSDLRRGLSKQRVGGLTRRGHSSATIRGSEQSSPLSGSL